MTRRTRKTPIDPAAIGALTPTAGDARYPLISQLVNTPGLLAKAGMPVSEGIDGDRLWNKLNNGVYLRTGGVYALDAVFATASKPSAPLNLQVANTSTVSTVTWTQPASNGAAPVTSYNVYRSATAGGFGATPYATGIIGTAYVDNAGGLTNTNSTSFYYTAKAVNLVGEGPASNQGPVFIETRSTAAPATAVQPKSWYRGDQLVSDGGKITYWPDIQTAGNTGSTGLFSLMARPTYSTATVNGFTTGFMPVRGSTNNRFLFPCPITSENYTIITVINNHYSSGTRQLLAGYQNMTAPTSGTAGDWATTAAPEMVTVISTGAVRTQVTGLTSSTATSPSPSAATGSLQIAVSSWGAGPVHPLTANLNGSTPGTANAPAYTAPACDGLAAGGPSLTTAGATGNYSTDVNYDLYEKIILPTTDAATIHAWTAYLGTIYGITVGAN